MNTKKKRELIFYIVMKEDCLLICFLLIVFLFQHLLPQ